jgi:hypothetical protein
MHEVVLDYHLWLLERLTLQEVLSIAQQLWMLEKMSGGVRVSTIYVNRSTVL